MQWTSNVIREKINTDNRWLFRAVLALYARQTYDERASTDTLYNNRRGFNKPDAPFLTCVAQILESGGQLSPYTVAKCRLRMCKYATQLARIANKKD